MTTEELFAALSERRGDLEPIAARLRRAAEELAARVRAPGEQGSVD